MALSTSTLKHLLRPSGRRRTKHRNHLKYSSRPARLPVASSLHYLDHLDRGHINCRKALALSKVAAQPLANVTILGVYAAFPVSPARNHNSCGSLHTPGSFATL